MARHTGGGPGTGPGYTDEHIHELARENADPYTEVAGHKLFYIALEGGHIDWVEAVLADPAHRAAFLGEDKRMGALYSFVVLADTATDAVLHRTVRAMLGTGAEFSVPLFKFSLRYTSMKLNYTAFTALLKHEDANVSGQPAWDFLYIERSRSRPTDQLLVMVDLLVERGATLGSDERLLSAALVRGNADLVKGLLARGAKATRNPAEHANFLSALLETKEPRPKVRLMVKNGVMDNTAPIDPSIVGRLIERDRKLVHTLVPIFERYHFVWRPDSHWRAPPGAQRAIETLLALRSNTKSLLTTLPIELMFLVFEQLF